MGSYAFKYIQGHLKKKVWKEIAAAEHEKIKKL